MTAPRVTWKQALLILALLVLTWLWLPIFWGTWIEPPQFPDNYRAPSGLSQDYWQYRRASQAAADRDAILVVGDSVVWGEYVDAGQTLADHLSQDVRFANGGLNGLHPLAMQGLVRYVVASDAAAKLIIHFNPLWFTSPERDLQVDQALSFNHPDLVPQRPGAVPAYQAVTADRLSVLVERHWRWRQWVRHIRLSYFDGQDPHRWSLEHPYEWPSGPGEDLRSFEKTRQKPIAWTERSIKPQDFAWVDLDTSLQWKAFRDLLTSLKSNGCRPLVLVGPFNTHLLTERSRSRHDELVTHVCQWLEEQQLPYIAPPTLASELYADASHPLSEGYRQWATAVQAHPAFHAW